MGEACAPFPSCEQGHLALDLGDFSEGRIVSPGAPSGLGLQLGFGSSPPSCGLCPIALRMLCLCSAGSQRPSVCAVNVDFLFFLFFLKSCLLLQVLTQENLATILTGVMVPAGAVTQPLLIPISIAGQVAGQQGLAVWTIPTATVAALPGLTAASPTGGIFKPPLAGLQGNGNSSQDCTRPPTTLHYTPARVLAMLDSEPTAHPGQPPWILDPVSWASGRRAAAPPRDCRP